MGQAHHEVIIIIMIKYNNYTLYIFVDMNRSLDGAELAEMTDSGEKRAPLRWGKRGSVR